MIYLTTGANGAGKTLNTLKTVRERQVKEGRTVYYSGFAMKPEKAKEFGWLLHDPKEWITLPDGAIVIVDECQHTFPLTPAGATLPEYVTALTEHRRRGFDFYLITQHPQNISAFVRRLIGSPGWHRHLKRAFGADMVSVLEWSAVNPNCEKNGAGKSAAVTMTPYPKEVYEWYDSAVLHTSKPRIPRQVYVIGVALLLVPLLGYFVVKLMTKNVSPSGAPAASAAAFGGPGFAPGGASPKLDYFASIRPRVEGLPHTAERYDEVLKPQSAPYPAVCIQGARKCDCYTTQATKLAVPDNLCRDIVARGYFKDWVPEGGGTGSSGGSGAAGGPVAAAGLSSVAPALPRSLDRVTKPVVPSPSFNTGDLPPTADAALLAYGRAVKIDPVVIE